MNTGAFAYPHNARTKKSLGFIRAVPTVLFNMSIDLERINAEVRGDSLAATVAVAVEWSALGPNDAQRAVTCRSYGEYEKQFTSDVRKKAEKAAAHH